MNGVQKRKPSMTNPSGSIWERGGDANSNQMSNYVPDYRLEPPPAPAYPCCPCCGSEMYDDLVLDVDGDVVGCSECMQYLTAEEYMEHINDEKW